MRETYSLPKLVTFSNDECLTTQVSVVNSDILPNANGKKIIKSGDLLVKATDGKVYIAKRRKPVSNTTVGTVGTLVLTDIDNIAVGDKLDFVFPGAIHVFAAGTGSRTLTIGDLSVTFAMGASGNANSLIAAYTAGVISSKQNTEHSINLVGTETVLIQSKTKAPETVTFTPSTNITSTPFTGVVGDTYVSGTLGTVTAINTSTKTVTYTAQAGFANLTLGTVGVRFKNASLIEDQILGICIQDYDLTGIDTRMIPLLTSSNGCYKSRLTYFDSDLVNQFPKIEFI